MNWSEFPKSTFYHQETIKKAVNDMADTKWADEKTKELRDYGIQLLTIGCLDANKVKRFCELIGDACLRIEELEQTATD